MDADRARRLAGFFFDHAFEGMAVVRLDDDVVVAANDAWMELTGYERPDVIGHTWAELAVFGESLPRGAREIERNEPLMRRETQIRTHAGEFRIVEERSRVVEIDGERFVLVAATDLTEERRLLQDLEASRSDLATAQAISQMGSYTFDVRTNEVLASDELLRLFWMEPVEFDGTLETILARLHPDDVEVVRDAIAMVVEERAVPTVRVRTVSTDGRVRWLQARGDLELDADDRAARVHGTAQDVTERVRLEERSRRLLERAVELRESDRRQIADEIQDGFLQSLSALLLRVESAVEGSADPDARYAVAQVIGAVRGSAERLRRLVFEVRPTALDHGIGPAVEELATRMLGSWDLHVDVEDATMDAVPEDVRAVVYRFLREALAALAPGVAAVRIALEVDLVVEVRHRGPGRLDDADRPLLEEAAELAGGRLELDTDGETRLRLRLPDPSLSVER